MAATSIANFNCCLFIFVVRVFLPLPKRNFGLKIGPNPFSQVAKLVFVFWGAAFPCSTIKIKTEMSWQDYKCEDILIRDLTFCDFPIN